MWVKNPCPNNRMVRLAINDRLIHLEHIPFWKVPRSVVAYIAFIPKKKSLNECRIKDVEVISKEKGKQEVVATIDGFRMRIKHPFYAECIINRLELAMDNEKTGQAWIAIAMLVVAVVVFYQSLP